MMDRRLVRFALCALMIPAAAAAQRSIEIGPMFAGYSPYGTYEHVGTVWRVGTPDQPNLNRAPGWGAEARVWATRRIGLQLQGATSSAEQPLFNTPGGGGVATTSRVTSFTAQAMYGLSGESARNRFWLTAGGGFIRHSGSAYEAFGSPTRPLGALGVGSSFPLWHDLAASVGASSLLYSWELSNAGATYQRGFQTDLLVHAGLTLRLH
jgi:hypothetical protein